MLGRTIVSSTIQRLDLETTIDISALNIGQYVLTVRTEKGITSKMFVKR